MEQLTNFNDCISVKELYEFLSVLIKNGKSDYLFLIDVREQSDEDYYITNVRVDDDDESLNIL